MSVGVSSDRVCLQAAVAAVTRRPTAPPAVVVLTPRGRAPRDLKLGSSPHHPTSSDETSYHGEGAWVSAAVDTQAGASISAAAMRERAGFEPAYRLRCLFSACPRRSRPSPNGTSGSQTNPRASTCASPRPRPSTTGCPRAFGHTKSAHRVVRCGRPVRETAGLGIYLSAQGSTRADRVVCTAFLRQGCPRR